jgi:hypothetical protein
MAQDPYTSGTPGADLYGSFSGTTEADMRAEFARTLDGGFPEVAKGQPGLLRRMRRDGSGNLIPCPCVDPITNEPDRDRHCHICVKGNTWVPTIHGVKRIKDIMPGEYALTSTGSYELVTDTYGRLYTGRIVQLYQVGRGSIPLELTADHEVFVCRPKMLCHHKAAFGKLCHPMLCNVHSCRTKRKGEFAPEIIGIRADEVQPGDYLVFPRNIRGQAGSQTSLQEEPVITVDWKRFFLKKGAVPKLPPRNIVVDEDLMTFLGWYVAEGSGCAASIKSRTVVFSLHENEVDVGNQLISISEKKFGISGILQEQKGTTKAVQVVIHSAVLSRWLHELCGKYAYFKKVPDFIWELNSDLQRAFLNAFMLGDGHRDVDDWETTGVVSERLAE